MIEFRIEYDINTDSFYLAIIMRNEGKYFVWSHIEKDRWEFREVTGENTFTPTLRFPYESRSLKQLADALAENGIKTDNDHKIEGTLEATRYHLEDLRKLLKVEKR